MSRIIKGLTEKKVNIIKEVLTARAIKCLVDNEVGDLCDMILDDSVIATSYYNRLKLSFNGHEIVLDYDEFIECTFY